jgi:hypothetical protein
MKNVAFRLGLRSSGGEACRPAIRPAELGQHGSDDSLEDLDLGEDAERGED